MAVVPLARLMLQGRTESVGADATAAARAAAWALSNLVRDGGPEVGTISSIQSWPIMGKDLSIDKSCTYETPRGANAIQMHSKSAISSTVS